MTTLLLAALVVTANPKSETPRVDTLVSIDAAMTLPALHAKGTHVVHFWATWCGPCREELPSYIARAKQLAAEGVDFTFISADEAEDVDTSVTPFLEKLGAFFPGAHHYVLGPDIDPQALTVRFSPDWVEASIPATFVYKSGKRTGDFRGQREGIALDEVNPGRPAPKVDEGKAATSPAPRSPSPATRPSP